MIAVLKIWQFLLVEMYSQNVKKRDNESTEGDNGEVMCILMEYVLSLTILKSHMLLYILSKMFLLNLKFDPTLKY